MVGSIRTLLDGRRGNPRRGRIPWLLASGLVSSRRWVAHYCWPSESNDAMILNLTHRGEIGEVESLWLVLGGQVFEAVRINFIYFVSPIYSLVASI